MSTETVRTPSTLHVKLIAAQRLPRRLDGQLAAEQLYFKS